MSYNLNLSNISVDEYKELLKSQNLLPARKILLDDIDKHFESIKKQNIFNIAQLKKQLATPQKISSFTALTGIAQNYLTILKREIGSLEQKPVAIDSFPDINVALISELDNKGITNSKHYYESENFNSDELSCLCDLVRINGVGAVAAKAFYEAGYRSVSDVAGADAADMLKRVTDVNNEKNYYKAKLGVKDMQFCIDYALLLKKYER
ncbi:MAG: DUF4332 domain-containing protein [Eubacteriaceae bacterium]